MSKVSWTTPLLLICVACNGNDPVGVYETTPESFQRSFEATWPQDDNPATEAMRQRFAGLEGKVTLELESDHSFRVVMELPLIPQPKIASGTWSLNGSTLELTSEDDDAATWKATLEDGSVTFQQDPRAPRFVLHKKM